MRKRRCRRNHFIVLLIRLDSPHPDPHHSLTKRGRGRSWHSSFRDEPYRSSSIEIGRCLSFFASFSSPACCVGSWLLELPITTATTITLLLLVAAAVAALGPCDPTNHQYCGTSFDGSVSCDPRTTGDAAVYVRFQLKTFRWIHSVVACMRVRYIYICIS